MADKARKLTDQELNKLEREIYELYATASNEISAEWRKYMASHKKTLDQAYNELQEAKKSGNRDAIAEANEKYERTVKNVTLNDIRYKAMLNETTAKLANINQIALDYVNGDMPKIYTLNYNAFGDEKIDGYTFTLVNERAIAALALSNEIRLPKKKVNIPKDEAWNAKNINSQLMQGILQGESVAKIAKRLQNVTNMNRNSAIRNARTMTTGAENQGRQDSFKKASSDGILMKRRWVATHDERVRAWHSDLDGVEVNIDEPFQNEFGDIMYPGDPSADAANVYNCRCSIRAVVKGFKWNKREETIDNTRVEHEVVNGKDISQTWTRRSDQFDFAIDDIVNAQGFDGLPKVLDDFEFENAVKESGLVFARGYSAPDEETLQAYHDQLLNGKWYIDCSKGGAVHGQGMYTAGNYGTKISDKTANLMESYSIGIGRTETMTLVKDAKIITDDALREKKEFLKYDYAKELIKKDLSADEDLVLKAMTMPGSMSFSEAAEALSKSPETSKAVYEEWAKVSKQVMDNISKLPTDQGQLAALFGYDAIEVNVSSRGDKYFVILNRTKLIIKR